MKLFFQEIDDEIDKENEKIISIKNKEEDFQLEFPQTKAAKVT